jgi:hypothetical protein
MLIRLSLCVLGTSFVLFGSALRADTIQLVNGDRLKGRVTSLDEKELVLKSESFGELKIPRDKVDLVSLGDKGLPDFSEPTTAPQKAGQAEQALGASKNLGQLLQDPAVQSQLGPMVEQLLGPKADQETQNRIDEARRGMKELRKDLGKSPEGDALESYIRFFEQIAPLARGLQDAQPRPPAKTRRPPQKPKETDTKSAEPGNARPDKASGPENPSTENSNQPTTPE